MIEKALPTERGKVGLVRRCHGDLHLGNIVLLQGVPVLFDALEFDENMASIDVLYDLAYLVMDLWERGFPQTLANRSGASDGPRRPTAISQSEGCDPCQGRRRFDALSRNVATGEIGA
jgi:Phosphotransferase enzyme family